jgi:hypothetical protein
VDPGLAGVPTLAAFLLINLLQFIMVFGVNLGEWCKWGSRMYFYVLKGPVFDVKRDQFDVERKPKMTGKKKNFHEND